MIQEFTIAMMKKLLPLLLLPSGCAALIYQVTWARLLGFSMGSTSAAISTVLTAFFLGLAIGSYFADKVLHGKLIDLRTFIILEFIIGASGLLLVPILLNLDYAMAILGESGSLLSVKFATSLIVLIVPTVCMGATYPVLASVVVHQQDKMGSDLGKLYALNTLGAVMGALICGFVLIPKLGIDGAVYVAAALNLCVVIAGYYLFITLKRQISVDKLCEYDASESSDFNGNTATHYRIAVVLFCTGFISIACEVAWTKYLSIFTGATIFGFAAILSIFLIGIALGSWVIKRYVDLSGNSKNMVIWLLVTLAVSLLYSRIGLAKLPELLEYSTESGFIDEYLQGGKYLMVFLLIFPATFMFGALFPVTVSLYCAEIANLRKRIGHAYAINTIGCILGSLLAGFWIIPVSGTDFLLSIMILIIAALPFMFVSKQSIKPITLIIISGIILLGTWQFPHLDYAKLIAASPYRFDEDAKKGKKPKFLFLKEGKTGVISVITYDDVKARLQNNGIQESYMALKKGLHPPFTEVLLGLMPYLLHPDPKTVHVIGFGGGNTLDAIANTPVEAIRVTELEPAVISANAVVFGGEIPVLQDPRVDLQINDARNSLLVEGQSYDLILSQPSHPWLAGAGNLFTKEFFEIAAANLNEGGISAQWVNLFNMDSTTLGSILKAYYEVYPFGFTMANTSSGDYLLLGSNKPLTFDRKRMAKRMAETAIRQYMSQAKVTKPEHLLWYFSLSRDEILDITAEVKPNTDTRIMSEVRLAGISETPTGDENPYVLLSSNYNFDVISYLNTDEAKDMLSMAGRYFYKYESKDRTLKAIEQLKSLDTNSAIQLKESWDTWRKKQRDIEK